MQSETHFMLPLRMPLTRGARALSMRYELRDGMSLDFIFSGSNLLAIAGWVALALAPLARGRLVMLARTVSLTLCALYLLYFLTLTEPSGGSFGSLAGIVTLFSKPGNVMMGWTHYLAFDLFIGSWETEDAGKRGMPHWLLLPCLVFTFMLGPVGLGLYFILRVAHGYWRATNVR
jgi:Domain of unknown function (DUF4281)